MLTEWLESLTSDPRLQAVVVLCGSLVLAFLTELVFRSVLMIFAQKTKTRLDDIIVAALRRPLFLSVLFLGGSWAASLMHPGATFVRVLDALLTSLAIVLWTGASVRICTAVLRHAATAARPHAILQPRTMPLFDILATLVLLGAGVYALMVTWTIDVTGWLASAGILGIALGFAAKDSLANLFAGIFILADAPYKIGDFIQFEDGLRGCVTDIGLRATRILTRDDIEINIPNQLIGNSRVVNETGGPHEKERVQIKVRVAYDTDVDELRRLLLACTDGVPHLCDDPRPLVLFTAIDAGLELALCVWCDQPRWRDDVVDAVNSRVHRALRAAGVDVPHTKHDLFDRRASPASTARTPGAELFDRRAPPT